MPLRKHYLWKLSAAFLALAVFRAEGRMLLSDPLAKSASPEIRFIGARPFQLRADAVQMLWNGGTNELLVSMGMGRVVVLSAKSGASRGEFPLDDRVWDANSPAGVIAGRNPKGSRYLTVASLKTGELLWEKELPSLVALRFSEDGTLLVTAESLPDGTSIKVFESTSGKLIRERPLKSRIHSSPPIALIDDGHALTVFEQPMVVDLETGEETPLAASSEDREITSEIDNISRDGRYVAALPLDGEGYRSRCVVWRRNTDQTLEKIIDQDPTETAGHFECIDFSEDSNRCVVSMWNTATVYSLKSGQKVGGGPDGGSAAAISPDGSEIAVACGGRIHINPTRDSSETPAPGNFEALALQPHGNLIAAAGVGNILLWDRTTGELRQTVKNPGLSLKALTFSPDGKGIYLSDGAGVWVKDLSAGTKTPIRVMHWEDEPSSYFAFDLSEDGHTMVAMRESRPVLITLGNDLESKAVRVRNIARVKNPSENIDVGSLRLQADAKRVLIDSFLRFQTIELGLDTVQNEVKTEGSAPAAITKDLSQVFAPTKVATAATVFDVETGKPLWIVPTELILKEYPNFDLQTLALDETHKFAAFSFGDEMYQNYGVAVLDLENHRLLKIFLTQRGLMKQLTFSEDGHILYGLNGDSSVAVIPVPESPAAAE